MKKSETDLLHGTPRVLLRHPENFTTHQGDAFEGTFHSTFSGSSSLVTKRTHTQTQNVESKRHANLISLRKKKTSAQECKKLKYSVGEMRLAGFTFKECNDAGFDVRKFQKGTSQEFEYYDFQEIRLLDLNAEELYSRKVLHTPREFSRAGFGKKEILKLKIESNVLKAFRMYIEGASLSECIKANLTARNCRDAGYSASSIYPLCKDLSILNENDEVVCWNQKSESEVPGSSGGMFRKSYFFGNVIDSVTSDRAHRVKSSLLERKFWDNEIYLRDQTPQGHLNNGFGPDRLLEWKEGIMEHVK